MKKSCIILILIIFALSLLYFIIGKLIKVDHFACSDYCPVPAEQYEVKIYPFGWNKYLCNLLGGTSVTYYGWGKFNICLAETN
ncbi:hypothetical protein A2960_03465 [Candidatus Gottesmanbacteria bacterium RIFCSPLOWO2_01_FULL_39_12b]|uniref:Uncharacterized protein n=1 Tax=Candidatus Gottesmanbacteria bacterium RIFCSPLOWO2_01_FULL_39_12b TaxID=1798388 RepID=A0A1F6ANU4_9BACT|nr:MAG: hypothetical protein A2960_03465 [Candidatus Gottesmanbacteria bacterium RIFCSPLOWO2_01_FULL_39_12b]